MLRLLNKNKQFVKELTDYREPQVESELQTGDGTLSFYYLGADDIPNEYYIETDQARYVVKEAQPDEDGCLYHAQLDLEELQGVVYKRFTSRGGTISAAAQSALADTGWTVSTDITSNRNVQKFKVTPLEIIYAIRDAWMCEVAFDNLNKVVTFRDKLGSDKGVYFMRGLNLRQASMTRDSYDFITRLIPYGADELTVASVNGGSMYIDNHQYSDKVIAMIWEDTNYDDASALLEDATKKLDDLSKPRRSYSADVIDLAKQSESYSAFEYKLGDTIHLIDNLTGVDDKQRIVKLTEYLDEPEKNTCELANTTLTFEEMQDRNSKAAAAWEEVSNSDGTVNGVYVHGISSENGAAIETIVNNSPFANDVRSNALVEVEVLYAQNGSPTTPPTSGWSKQAPEWQDGQYMWQKTVQTTMDGEEASSDETNITGATGATGAKGEDGNGINSVTITYGTSDSSRVLPSIWGNDIPDVDEGAYLWTRIITDYTDPEMQDTVSYYYARQGADGEQGERGTSVTVSAIEYQAGASPTSEPTGTWSSSVVAVPSGQYLWTRTTFSDGSIAYGVAKQGEKGDKGEDGNGIQSTTITYGESASASSVPSSWSPTMPTVAAGNYLWTKIVIDYTDPDMQDSVTYTYAKQGEKGEKGDTGQAGTSVTVSRIEYQAGTSPTTAPSGTWSTSPVEVAQGQYLWTKTTFSDGSTSYGVARQGTDGQPGAAGKGIDTMKTQYYLSTSAQQVQDGEWSDNVPTFAYNRYYWTRLAITWTDGSQPTYTTPVLDNGLTDASTNGIDAVNAANSKNMIYRGASAPTGVTLHSGDVWFDTDNDNEIKIYDGSSWVSTSLGENALDILYVARAVCAYLDVNSLSAQDAQILFGTFQQIKSQDGLSYWDLKTGEFKTNNGKFTGTITGSTLATNFGAQKSVEVIDEGTAYVTDLTTADGKVTVEPTGVMARESDETIRSQILQALLKHHASTNPSSSFDFWDYGWYFTKAIYSPRIFTFGGEVITGSALRSKIATIAIGYDNAAFDSERDATSYSTGVSGVVGSVWGKMATLVFNGLSIPAGTASGTVLGTLNDVYKPKNQLDLSSNLNAQRIYVSTSGVITSAGGNSGSGALAFRCTVSYVRNVS